MNTENLHFYGNSININDESEIEEGTTYLNLWKKYFVKKLPDGAEVPEEPIYTQLLYRPHDEILSMKIAVRYTGEEPLPKRYAIYRTGLTDEN